MSKKNRIIIISIIVVLTCAVAALAICVSGSKERRLNGKLAIARELLSDHDYEKAIAAFDEALDIDPMSVDAYLGKAEAYEGLGDDELSGANPDYDMARECYEEAIAVLDKGINMTGDPNDTLTDCRKRIESKLDEMDSFDKASLEESIGAQEVIYEEPEFIAVSVKGLVESPTFNGACWLEYDGLDGMRATVAMEPYDSDNWNYLEWIMTDDYLVRYGEDDSYRQMFVGTDFLYENEGSKHGGMIDNFCYVVHTDIQDDYEELSCEYMLGFDATSYADGFNNYMAGNGYSSATDVVNALGIDTAKLKSGEQVYANTEYGDMYVGAYQNDDGWAYYFSIYDNGSYGETAFAVEDRSHPFSGNQIVELRIHTKDFRD